jgi:tetratricopeptide (TPR) repeat protein
LNEITREAPDSLHAWRFLAQIALAEKKLDDSLKLLDNAILRDPSNIDARLLQAQVWLAQGQVKKAIEGLESLDKSYSKVVVIKCQLARAYLQDKNAAQATFVLNQALARDANNVEARLLLGEISLRNGNAQEVATSMLDLLKKRPGLSRAQVILAQAYQSLGRLDDAAAIFREQIKSNPKSPAAYLSLGLIQRQQGKLNEARATIETAQRLAPKSLLAASQLVDLDIQGKDYNAALRRVRDQLQVTPDSPGVYFLEGKIYAAQGKWDDAEAALLKTLERDPSYPNASGVLVSTYLAADKLPKAIALLEGDLARDPDDARALMTVAMICERTKDFPRAREAYEKLVLLKPDYAPALNNLAYLYAEHFDLLDKARELGQKARALQPADPGIADTLGWILCKKGDYQQALTLLRESARKLPQNAEVHFHLGMANYMMGQKESAKEAFLRAAATPNDFPGKEEVQRRLALLESVDGKAVELATKDLEAALKQQPDDPVARMRLAEFYEKEGAFPEAAAVYEDAIKLNPNLLAAAVKLAELNAGPLKANDKALRFAQKARELAPNDAKVLAILGAAAYQAGNFPWSYSLLQEANSQLPDDPETLRNLAWAAYSQGKLIEAQNSMQRVLVKAKTKSAQAQDAQQFIAMTTLDNDEADLSAAQAEVERILSAAPDYVPALMLRARILAQRGDSDGAVATYSEVLSHFPNFAPAQKRLASIYLEIPEKLDEAYNLAARARKNLPDDPEVAQILAEASYEKRKFGYAIHLLQESASEKPLGAKQLYILGMSHFKEKDRLRSRKALEKALDSGHPEPFAEDASVGSRK